MSKLKDKLSASVRQAKAGQTPAGKATAAAKSVAPAAKVKPVAAVAPAAPVVKPAANKPAAAPSQVSPLYPNRVWPD